MELIENCSPPYFATGIPVPCLFSVIPDFLRHSIDFFHNSIPVFIRCPIPYSIFPYSGFYTYPGTRCFIVIVWRPLEYISTPSFKTVGDREKVLWDNMSGATRITL